MKSERSKDPAAVSLGRRGGLKGGRVKSAAKTAACRENGKKGGRPKFCRITLSNAFHGTSVEVAPQTIKEIDAGIFEITLSASQWRRADHALCGMHCSCGGIYAAGVNQSPSPMPQRDGGVLIVTAS